MHELPVQNRDSPAALFTLELGVTLSGAVTGARLDQNNATLDGLDVNDFATGSAFTVVGQAPVDSVQEFRGTVAGNLANSGPGGGGQFQLVTKSGTNSFHGALNEYHRDTSTVAKTIGSTIMLVLKNAAYSGSNHWLYVVEEIGGAGRDRTDA